ncbi:MFS transporter [Modicisalibacter luteus]|uniref:MFS transporter n=1 Tax=Modicisalibacter luteus TaxID=453962 RepID=A0ABV7LYT8_9GAMM|nr:MFS transporter [Halomonas lutea]GHA95549.1 MFS transporter [Halomonas lutea]
MSELADSSSREVRLARLGVLGLFLINGLVTASLVPHIPLFQARLDLTPGWLGIALLGVAIGAIVSMPLTAQFIERYTSRTVVMVATPIYCLALIGPIVAPSLPILFAALVLFGLGNGSMDVAMNAQAVDIEKRYGRPIMSSFHGFFSLGGLVGAGGGGLLLEMGLAPWAHVSLLAAVLLVACVPALRVALHGQGEASGPQFVLPRGALLGVGVLALFTLFCEGAMNDWSAIYLRDAFSLGPGLAAMGYASFSLTMTLGRLFGDRVVARVGRVLAARLSAALAASGMTLTLLAPSFGVALVGFGIIGLGLANMIPILFSAAGNSRTMRRGPAIAAVATLGYAGLLTGPPLIGFVAQLTSLTTALAMLIVAMLSVIAFASIIRRA